MICDSCCSHHGKILVIEDRAPPSGTEASDVVVDFELSFSQAEKQLLSSSVALNRFQKDSAVAEVVDAKAPARCGPVSGE
jgi:hypothetical protein